ncbi:DUF5682 family protein [Nocardia asteroides]|uniref:DUF5682 family protein n=1 Tax=Nocardia asteroides TaxID=1824 RepID=UPI001E407320|nr:DUF5682 family protein [Nocardia asteroides]UGT64145.1 DUF5682 family protein [Nocardia asteroides]
MSTAVTRVFGIRHHGPGSARSLRAALAEFRPDIILIEGPADADPLVGYVGADGMAPPVALLAYVPGEPARAAFWPFASFSPEWQALRYGAEHGVPVRFCDLPSSHVLAAREHEPAEHRDPLAELAAAAGYDDAERWWDAVVESAADSGAFDAIAEAMRALREPATSQGEPGESAAQHGDAPTLRREAYMRQTMRKALREGAERLAVVCGAWHAPALDGPLGPAAPDTRLLTGLPKVKTASTWVPWTHSRLATASGYGAGITSPGWYHHLFTETEQPVVRWLTRVANVLRAHDLPVSSAHVIEATRLAETLAALRARPLAGLSEVTEAVRAVMCGGEETLVRLIAEELVIGEALGAVPADTPTVPLAADLTATARSLRLKQEPSARSLDLDLRKERELRRSHLLHRLRVLGVEWGVPAQSQVRGTGTFRETWTLCWEPEYALAVIEASRWGTTLRTAAEARILDHVADADITLADLATALDTALLADLGAATDGLIARLDEVAALDHDVTHLLGVLPGLLRTRRYGDVRGTDVSALGRVADGLLVRICAGLPGAVTGLDTEAAENLRDQIDAANAALRTGTDGIEQWQAALRVVADRDDVHGALAGRAVRLLADVGEIDDAESALRLGAALSVGRTAQAKAAWIDGFLGGRGLLLVHDRELLRLVDEWVRGLGDDQFTEVLPLLRRTFGAFEQPERRAIGRAIRGGARAESVRGAIDLERGELALRAALTILAAAPRPADAAEPAGAIP